ncbi:hypothetical protein N0V93_010359 [Gnomoniopsis smithogilvyi]|uniref:Uncharacterized protein n=1 Tax=Gnomoniopsis smithogilvyi TaxID=1191159 RepID=A0A9W8YHT3_9PEZI|nr:hypothetical protein N0V93_010359 [Gnomoniopsis smithogilvyi]
MDDKEDSDMDDVEDVEDSDTAKGRQDKQQKPRVQELVDPFTFAPDIRPLGTSDLQSEGFIESL